MATATVPRPAAGSLAVPFARCPLQKRGIRGRTRTPRCCRRIGPSHPRAVGVWYQLAQLSGGSRRDAAGKGRKEQRQGGGRTCPPGGIPAGSAPASLRPLRLASPKRLVKLFNVQFCRIRARRGVRDLRRLPLPRAVLMGTSGHLRYRAALKKYGATSVRRTSPCMAASFLPS